MRKTILVSLLTIMLHAAVPHAEAQQPAKIAKIGWLAVRPASAAFVNRVVPARI